MFIKCNKGLQNIQCQRSIFSNVIVNFFGYKFSNRVEILFNAAILSIIILSNILHVGMCMNKKIIIRKIILLLTLGQNSFSMNNNKIVFNDILGSYFLKRFNAAINDENQLVLYTNIIALAQNKKVYSEEKVFLDNFCLCNKIAKISKLMYTYYQEYIIQEYARDFLILAFITKDIRLVIKGDSKNNYFYYPKNNKTIIDNAFDNRKNHPQLSRAQMQRMFYALIETYGARWEQCGGWMDYRLSINRHLQKRILLEIVETKSFLLNKDLQKTLQSSMGRFDPNDFATFLNKNNIALIFTDQKNNEQVNCEEILRDPDFKDRVLSTLNELPEDQKFFFMHEKNECETMIQI